MVWGSSRWADDRRCHYVRCSGRGRGAGGRDPPTSCSCKRSSNHLGISKLELVVVVVVLLNLLLLLLLSDSLLELLFGSQLHSRLHERGELLLEREESHRELLVLSLNLLVALPEEPVLLFQLRDMLPADLSVLLETSHLVGERLNLGLGLGLHTSELVDKT